MKISAHHKKLMNSERWQKVKSVLEEVLEIAPASRSAFLEKSCNGDKDLRVEVESLLDFETGDADLLEESAFSIALETGAEKFIGKQIGKYKIISELGAGGMGVVFLAERADGEFLQKVALKLIKRGIGSDSILRRFVNERQILASLQHPNIAHLIDGGTTDDNLPYFVMEYVEGETILEFARRKNLSVEQRLDLFREVCAAVQFAHQNLVIHRDLKPSNILVNAGGAPKLLDFGIAKLLKTEITDQTATQHFAFTPEYASPEQVRGEKLTTATDIYSLGVIIYELLTDARPFSFENKNFGQIVQTVTTSEPVRPSSVLSPKSKIQNPKSEKLNRKSPILNAKSLKGDLDNIILKSLKGDAERRYSSVEQFSEDIRRHLKGLPITARQDTLFYRAEKFTRRNPLVVGAIALAFLILIGGIAATAYQARKANIEREKAERRFNDVRALANSFMFEINEEITKSPIRARELLVQRAIEYLDKLAAEAEDDVELQSELAAAYEKIGDVQSQLFSPGLGKTSEALTSHRKSLEIRERLFSAAPQDINRGLEVVKSRVFVGDILSMSGRVGEARTNYQETVEFCRRLLRLDEKNTQIRLSLARSYGRIGQSILRSGALGDALRNYEESLKIYQNLAAENPSEEKFQRSVGYIFSYIGYVKIEMNQPPEAVRYFADALAIEEKWYNPESRQSQNDIANANLWLGVAHSENADWEKSSLYLGKALETQRQLFESDKNNFGEQNGLADCYLELGRDAVRAKKPNDAIKNLDKAIENYEAVWQTDRQNFSARRQIAFAQIWLGDAFRQKNDLQKASEIYAKSLEIIKELTAADANNTEWQHDQAVIHLRLGEIAFSRSDKTTALQNLETAKPIFEKLSAQSPDHAKRRADLESVKNLLAKLS